MVDCIEPSTTIKFLVICTVTSFWAAWCNISKTCSADLPSLDTSAANTTSPDLADLALGALFRRQTLEPEYRVALFSKVVLHFKTLVVFPQAAMDGLSHEQYIRNIVEVLFKPENK